MKKIIIASLLLAITLARHTESCGNGVFNFGGVNYRDISVSGSNVHTTNHCVGPFEGQSNAENVAAAIADWNLSWTYDASVSAGSVDGPNTVGMTWGSINHVKYHVEWANRPATFNSAAFTVQTDDHWSTYVLRCIKNDADLSGIFNGFGAETFNNAVVSVSVHLSNDASCNAEVHRETSEDAFDCIERLRQRVVDLESENSEIRAENGLFSAQVNGLTDSNSHLKDKLTDLVTEINNLNDANAGLTSDLAAANQRIEELTQELAECNAANDALTEVNGELNSQVTALTERNAELDAENAGLREDLADCDEALGACEGENTGLHAEIDSLNAIIEGLREELTTLRASYDACVAENAGDDSVIDNLRAQLQACQNEKDELNEIIAELTAQIVELNEALAACQEDGEEVVQAGNAALNRCITDLAAANATITSLRAEIADLQSQIASLTSQLSNCESRVDACNANLNTATQALNDCNNHVSELNGEIADLNGTVNCRSTNLSAFAVSMDLMISELNVGCSAEDFQP